MSATLNGVDLAQYIAEGSVERQAPQVTGARRRSFGGSFRRDVNIEREGWKAKTVPVTHEIAQALRGLIEGRGDALTFEDFWSARGTPVALGALTSPDAGLHGASSMFVLFGDPPNIDLSDIIANTWTVFGWRKFDPSDPLVLWEHLLLRSDGVARVNAAVAAVTDVSVSSGVLEFNPSSGDAIFDDWCAVPYLVPTTWVSQIYAEHVARSIASNLRKPRASGDLFPAARNVRGRVIGSSVVPHFIGGVWTPNAEVLEFTLEDA